MALLLSRVINAQLRAPYYAGYYPVDWRISWTLNLLQTTLAPRTPFKQTDWPVPFGPFQFNRGFSASYNLNLIGQDKLPAGKQFTDLTARPTEAYPYRSWTYSYNLNLIGKDRLPPGEASTDLTPRPYEHHIQLRSWAWSYNLNLIGKDKLPPGEQVYDLPPTGPTYPVSLRSWIAQPIIQTPTVPPVVVPRAPYYTPLRAPLRIDYDIYRNSVLLSGVVQQPPFSYQFYTDRPYVPPPPLQPWQSSYNLNLIGKDQLPNRQQDWPLPGQPWRQPDLNTWVQRTTAYLQNPFNQTDWPVPKGPTPLLQTWTYSYNLNLIGQDKLPPGGQVTDLPPRDYDRSIQLRTWIQSSIVVPNLPFNQYDWPVPKAPQQPAFTWTNSYNLNLIGKDKLPNRQQDWPNPTQPALQPDLRTWIQRTTAYLYRPFAQYDWPVPKGPTPLLQTWAFTYNRNLIGKDKLPNRQQDWPVPKDPRDFRGFANPLNVGLYFPPQPQPHNQFDWQVPRGTWDGLDRTVAVRSLTLGIPPPTPPVIITERPWVRDWWDSDEWGNFFPGSGIRRG